MIDSYKVAESKQELVLPDTFFPIRAFGGEILRRLMNLSIAVRSCCKMTNRQSLF